MQALVVPLSQLDSSALPLAGGKAANLGELLRAGFAVPAGFCITTTAYQRALEAGIGTRLAEALARLDVADTGRLATAATAIRRLFYDAPIPQDVGSAVLAAAEALGAGPFAVRSSATAEDLPDASFAGQMETFLNVIGNEALLEAVRRCWGSLWTDRAIAYRQRNGIAHEGVAIAVVVQRMVPAEVAGVLFTANPISGKRTEVTIEASFGLGEAVVSGLVTPDSYVVNKDRLEIVSQVTHAKTARVIWLPAGGTANVPVEGAEALRPSLDADAISRLARLGMRIEGHFGRPQDVEWALAGDDIFVLQSRPITSLYPPAPPAPAEQLRVYFSINSAQGVVEPLTPLGISLFMVLQEVATGKPAIAGYAETLARDAASLSTNQCAASERPLLVEVGGRLFADVTALLRNRLGRLVPRAMMPQVEPVASDIILGLLSDPRLTLVGRSPARTLLRLLRYWRTLLPLPARLARFIATPKKQRRIADEVIVARLIRLRAEVARPMALGEQKDVLRAVARCALRDLFLTKFFPMVASGLLCIRLAQALVDHFGLDRRLLAKARQGLPNNKTTTMDLDLWDLAVRVGSDPVARAAIADGEPGELTARYRGGSLQPVIQEGLTSFLGRYSHRGIREIDIGMPRWGDEPSYLFGILRSYIALVGSPSAPDRHFAAQTQAADSAVAELVAATHKQRFGWLSARLLAFFLGRYRQLGGARESPKFYMMWLFQAIRQMLLAAGAQMVELGLLDQADDVRFLRVEEIGPAAAGLSPRDLVAERRRAYERELGRRRVPRVLTSEGEALYAQPASVEGNILDGTGVSPGVARGVAHVIRSPIGAKLKATEILVAPSTDPAWTPLFLTASGLVMEAGGMMSHGATVAREYGIPAVAGVAEATDRITTGQQLEVDGDQGQVRLV